jgi:hypothetical protein
VGESLRFRVDKHLCGNVPPYRRTAAGVAARMRKFRSTLWWWMQCISIAAFDIPIAHNDHPYNAALYNAPAICTTGTAEGPGPWD